MPHLRAADLGVVLPPLATDRSYEAAYGAPVVMSPLVRRVLARNPNAFTFHGTGTYIIGRGRVAVVDPGPLDDAHLAALEAALQGETVTHILITHTHRDHSPAAAPLKAATGARTYGFGPHGGQVEADGAAVEEGGDTDFRPDVTVRDGDVISGDGWSVEAIHTPGHTSNHLCFGLREERALFSGDHVMGWSTTVIAPPDGNMAEYFVSLEKLLGRDDQVYYPTHGSPVRQPQSFVRQLIAHRHARERQIEACLARDLCRIADMVPVIYSEVDSRLHAPASRSVLAHLLHMVATGRVACDGAAGPASVFRLAR